MPVRIELRCKECGDESFAKQGDEERPIYTCLECGQAHHKDELVMVEVEY